jgi:hypothetical protein
MSLWDKLVAHVTDTTFKGTVVDSPNQEGMMAKQIIYGDMTISVNVFSGMFHVQCRTFNKNMSAEDLAKLIYPAVDAAATLEAGPAPSMPPISTSA